MKINFDQHVLDLDGKDIVDPETKNIYTLKSVSLNAIYAMIEDDRGVAGDVLFKRYELCRRINKGGEQELDPEELTLIRNRLWKVYMVRVAGPAYEMLKG